METIVTELYGDRTKIKGKILAPEAGNEISQLLQNPQLHL
jgi:hypothetical protein